MRICTVQFVNCQKHSLINETGTTHADISIMDVHVYVSNKK